MRLKRTLLGMVAVGHALVGPSAHALTEPLPGAVASPVPVPAPFPPGSTITLLSGYGPGGGSSLHADTNDPSKANDHYALDIVYTNEPNSGLGLPIVAPWAGEVVRAGWATSGWANYGQRVILRHDLGDGHVYHSLYAHLNAIDGAVVEGGMVAAGQVLGELGQSCQGALSCGSFGTPHLHWAIHRDSTVGGSGTGGSYGGNAVVPEALSGYEDLTPGMILEIGDPVCGDGACNGGEDSTSCAEDCPSCAPIGDGGRTIEETDICFQRFGSPQYWYDADVGSDGALLWTHAVEVDTSDNNARWNLVFELGGPARVEAWIEPGFAGSTQARYQVGYGAMSTEVVVDQSTADGWVELGTFDFVAGGDQFVTLADNTGEAFDLMHVLAFDAIRVTPLGGGGDSSSSAEAGESGGSDSAGSVSEDSGGDASAGDVSAGDASADGTGVGSDGGLISVGLDGGGESPSGCGCTATPPRPAAWAWLLLLGVRRRRHA